MPSSGSTVDCWGYHRTKMVVLEIDFGTNRKDDVVVCYGDDPRDLAEKFVEKHSLKASAIDPICNTINEAIDDFKRACGPNTVIDIPIKLEETKEEIFLDKQTKLSPEKKIGYSKPEDYGGQPPVALRVDGLPDMRYSDHADNSIRMLSKQFPAFPERSFPTDDQSPFVKDVRTDLQSIPAYSEHQVPWKSSAANGREITKGIACSGWSTGIATIQNAFNFTDKEPLLFAEENPILLSSKITRIRSNSAGRVKSSSSSLLFGTGDKNVPGEDRRTQNKHSTRSLENSPISIKSAANTYLRKTYSGEDTRNTWKDNTSLITAPTTDSVHVRNIPQHVPKIPADEEYSSPRSTFDEMPRFLTSHSLDSSGCDYDDNDAADRDDSVDRNGDKRTGDIRNGADMSRNGEERGGGVTEQGASHSLDVSFTLTDCITSSDKNDKVIAGLSSHLPVLPVTPPPVRIQSDRTPRPESQKRPVSLRIFDYFGSNMSSKELQALNDNTVYTEASPSGEGYSAASAPLAISPRILEESPIIPEVPAISLAVINRLRSESEGSSSTLLAVRSGKSCVINDNSNNISSGVDRGECRGEVEVEVEVVHPLLSRRESFDDISVITINPSPIRCPSPTPNRTSVSTSASPPPSRSRSLSPVMKGEGGGRVGPSSASLTDTHTTTRLRTANSGRLLTGDASFLPLNSDINTSLQNGIPDLESLNSSPSGGPSAAESVALGIEYFYDDPAVSRSIPGGGSRVQVGVSGGDGSHSVVEEGSGGREGGREGGEEENGNYGDNAPQSRSVRDIEVGADDIQAATTATADADVRATDTLSVSYQNNNEESDEEYRFNALRSLKGRNHNLMPSTSTLTLNRDFRPESEVLGSILSTCTFVPNIAKPLGHRLHDSATKSRLRKEKKIAEMREQQQQQRKASMFTVTGSTAAILNNTTTTGRRADVCTRLYDDGLRDLKTKKSQARDKLIEWACVRCGVFQATTTTENCDFERTYVQRRNDFDSSSARHQSMNNSYLSVKSDMNTFESIQVCRKCGFEQDISSHIIPYKRSNSGTFHEECSQSSSFLGASRQESYNARGCHQNKNNSTLGENNRPSIYDELFADKKHEDVMRRATLLNSRNEAADFTFRPLISEGSLQILQSKLRDGDGVGTDGGHFDGTPGTGRGRAMGATVRVAPHRSQSTGAYPKSFPLPHNRQCSSSFAPPSRQSADISFSERNKGWGRERDKDRRRSHSAPQFRTLAEYLQTPATERLFHTKHSPSSLSGIHRSKVHSDVTDSNYNTQDNSPYKMNTPVKTAPPPRPTRPITISSDKYQNLVERLTHESIERNERRDRATADATSKDPSTGKKYFQPTVPPRVMTPNKERNGYRDGDQERNSHMNLNYNYNLPRESHRNNVLTDEREEMYNGNIESSRYNIDRIENHAARKGTGFSPLRTDPANSAGSNRISPGSKRTARDVYNDLMRKDKERLQRRKSAQLQCQRNIDNTAARKQSTTSKSSSAAILKEANKRKVRELFKFLLMTSAPSPSPPSPPSSPPSSPPHTSSHMSPYFSPPGDGNVFSSRDSAVRVVSLAPVSDRQSNPTSTSTSSRNRNSNRNRTDNRNKNGDGNSWSVYGLDDDAYGIGMDVFSVSYSTEGQGEGEKVGEVHPRPSPSSFPCPPHRSVSGNVSQNVSQNINHSGSVSQNMSFVSVMSTPDNSETNPMGPGTTLHTSQSQSHSNPVPDWETRALDLNSITMSDLHPDVASFIMQVRDERNRKMHLESGSSSSDTSLLSLSYSMEMKNSRVDHKEFLALASRCLQRTGGMPGKGNPFRRKHTPQPVTEKQMLEEAECVFHPKIDQTSVALSLARENREKEKERERERDKSPLRSNSNQHTNTNTRHQNGSAQTQSQYVKSMTAKAVAKKKAENETHCNVRTVVAPSSGNSLSTNSDEPYISSGMEMDVEDTGDGERGRGRGRGKESEREGNDDTDNFDVRGSNGINEETEREEERERERSRERNQEFGSRSGPRSRSSSRSGIGSGSCGGSNGRTSELSCDPSAPRRSTPIEVILQVEGQKRASRILEARQKYLQVQKEIHTFKPTLIKPPTSVVARYKTDRDIIPDPPPPPSPPTESESVVEMEVDLEPEFHFRARVKSPDSSDSTDGTYVNVQRLASIRGEMYCEGEDTGYTGIGHDKRSFSPSFREFFSPGRGSRDEVGAGILSKRSPDCVSVRTKSEYSDENQRYEMGLEKERDKEKERKIEEEQERVREERERGSDADESHSPSRKKLSRLSAAALNIQEDLLAIVHRSKAVERANQKGGEREKEKERETQKMKMANSVREMEKSTTVARHPFLRDAPDPHYDNVNPTNRHNNNNSSSSSSSNRTRAISREKEKRNISTDNTHRPLILKNEANQSASTKSSESNTKSTIKPQWNDNKKVRYTEDVWGDYSNRRESTMRPHSAPRAVQVRSKVPPVGPYGGRERDKGTERGRDRERGREREETQFSETRHPPQLPLSSQMMRSGNRNQESDPRSSFYSSGTWIEKPESRNFFRAIKNRTKIPENFRVSSESSDSFKYSRDRGSFIPPPLPLEIQKKKQTDNRQVLQK